MPSGTSEIVVVNEYDWLLDPRWGAFTVYLDGHRAGVAPVSGSFNAELAPGTHRVRVRHRWYMSAGQTVTLAPGSRVVLRANMPGGSVGRTMLRLAIRPLTSLALTQDLAVAVSLDIPTGVHDQDLATKRNRFQRAVRVYALVSLVVFGTLLVLLGSH